jgi:ankyrin repeat protein
VKITKFPLPVIPLVFLVLCSCADHRGELKKRGFEFSEKQFIAAATKGDLEAVKLFLKAGMDANIRDELGWTPLIGAILESRRDVVDFLLSKGADPNDKGGFDWDIHRHFAEENSRLTGEQPRPPDVTPLMIAAQKGNVFIVKALLARGADPKATDGKHSNAIHWAAGSEAANVEVMQALIDAGADSNLADKNGATALMSGAKRGDAALVEVLLRAGANVNAIHSSGSTALTVAAAEGHAAIVALLASKGAAVDHRDREDATPLLRAAIAGRRDVVKVLLEHKANPNVQSKAASRWTPLMAACKARDAGSVKLLLDHGANPNLKGDQGSTPVLIAALNGCADCIAHLAKKGADLNARESRNGNIALALAQRHRHRDVVKALLEAGADPNIADKGGYTPLISAAMDGDYEVARFLLQKKADPNLQASSGPRKGITALMSAAAKGHLQVAALLIDSGADPSIKDEAGTTAYSYAVHNKHAPIADLIGANQVRNLDDSRRVIKKQQLIEVIKRGEAGTALELMAKGVDLNEKDSAGWTPLMHALSGDHSLIAGALLDRGADPAPVDANGWGAVHLAAFRGDNASLGIILQKGIQAGALTVKKTTPLILAAGNGHTETVELLLEHKADPDHRDAEGKTALDYAREKNHAEAGELLQKASSGTPSLSH